MAKHQKEERNLTVISLDYVLLTLTQCLFLVTLTLCGERRKLYASVSLSPVQSVKKKI